MHQMQGINQPGLSVVDLDQTVDFFSGCLDWEENGRDISAEVGMRKPDAGIYQAFLDASGYAANELLFVDDRNNNVVAARNLGIDSIRFDPQRGFDPVHRWLAAQT